MQGLEPLAPQHYSIVSTPDAEEWRHIRWGPPACHAPAKPCLAHLLQASRLSLPVSAAWPLLCKQAAVIPLAALVGLCTEAVSCVTICPSIIEGPCCDQSWLTEHMSHIQVTHLPWGRGFPRLGGLSQNRWPCMRTQTLMAS